MDDVFDRGPVPDLARRATSGMKLGYEMGMRLQSSRKPANALYPKSKKQTQYEDEIQHPLQRMRTPDKTAATSIPAIPISTPLFQKGMLWLAALRPSPLDLFSSREGRYWNLKSDTPPNPALIAFGTSLRTCWAGD